MAHKRTLSIIIVNFNTLQFTKECITSIIASDLPGDEYEIILVDNASTDTSVSVLSKLPGITFIKNTQNLGFAAANNAAIQSSSGEYVLLLNPDTIIQKDTLNTMLNFMKTDRKTGIATCRVELPDGNIDDGCHRGFPTPWNALCHFSGLSRIFPYSKFFNGYHLGYQSLDKTHEIDACVGAFMMIRRDVGESLGWLDESYFWYGEDIDFCYRAKEKNWKVMYVPDTKIIHYKGVASGIKKHSESLSTADKDIKIQATKSRFAVMRIFYRKHYDGKYPSWLMWLVMAGIGIKEYFTLKKIHYS